MTDFQPNIGPSASRRRIATLVAVIGVVFIGSRLAQVWPRDVEVIYEVGPDVRELDVDYVQSDEAVASVRFARTAPELPFFRHMLRLQPGKYQIQITLYARDGSATERSEWLAVPGAGVTRLDLRDGTGSPE
jgi:hypothetical protein